MISNIIKAILCSLPTLAVIVYLIVKFPTSALLLVIILVVGISLGWAIYYWTAVSVQRRAVSVQRRERKYYDRD
jgi:hypothetical protein